MTSDTRGDLRAAGVHQAVDAQAHTLASRHCREDTAERLVDEELRRGAAVREAAHDACGIDVRESTLHAADGARDLLEARLDRAHAAVLLTVAAGLVGRLTNTVAADVARTAVLLAARARLGRLADAVAAAHALAAVLRAAEARLVGRRAL